MTEFFAPYEGNDLTIEELRAQSLAIKARSLKSMKRFRVALPAIQAFVSLMQLSSIYTTIADGHFGLVILYIFLYFIVAGLGVWYWKNFSKRIRNHVTESVVARLKGEFPYDTMAD